VEADTEMSGGKISTIVLNGIRLLLSSPLIFGHSLAYASETVVVDKAFNSREIKVRMGGIIRVDLEQASAADHVWDIKDLDQEHFEEIVRAPVLERWVVRAKAKGKSQLTFIHSRPWKGEEEAADTFALKVRIL
jgi:predicted secreted protein